MSPNPKTIAWHAKFFKMHAAQWRTLAGKASEHASALKACPPTEPQTWVWPDLAAIKVELDRAQDFFLNEFLGRASSTMEQIADMLEETQKTYINQEAEGRQEIINQVNKELEG